MAYSRVKTGGDGYEYSPNEGYYHEYIVDSSTDVANLPTGGTGETATGRDKPRPGSKCYVVNDCETYILSVARQWTSMTPTEG